MRKTTVISVTKQLINVNAVSLNFNLREPKGNKATNVYAVIRLGSIARVQAVRRDICISTVNYKLQITVLKSTNGLGN